MTLDRSESRSIAAASNWLSRSFGTHTATRVAVFLVRLVWRVDIGLLICLVGVIRRYTQLCNNYFDFFSTAAKIGM